MADAVVDAHTQEQGRLLRAFHFGQDRPKDEWSSTGPRSLSPFVPCASARIAAVFSAARLTHEDVLWDLGCGDGRVLHQAAVQHGCRCVGLEIDRACVDEAQLRAAEQGVAERCRFAVADLMRLPTGAMASGVLDANRTALLWTLYDAEDGSVLDEIVLSNPKQRPVGRGAVQTTA